MMPWNAEWIKGMWCYNKNCDALELWVGNFMLVADFWMHWLRQRVSGQFVINKFENATRTFAASRHIPVQVSFVIFAMDWILQLWGSVSPRKNRTELRLWTLMGTRALDKTKKLYLSHVCTKSRRVFGSSGGACVAFACVDWWWGM